jgi:hypothetical protein
MAGDRHPELTPQGDEPSQSGNWATRVYDLDLSDIATELAVLDPHREPGPTNSCRKSEGEVRLITLIANWHAFVECGGRAPTAALIYP